MKWIGQHVWDFVSRFRSSVYMEYLHDVNSDDDKIVVVTTDSKIETTSLLDFTNSGDLKITTADKGVVFEGGTYDTKIIAATPSANRAITLPNATGTAALTDDLQLGWHGSTTRIKILHSDFIPDDGGRAYSIDDTGVGSENLFGESYSNHTSYVTVAIPTGYTATHVMIYGSATGAIEVWEHQINSKTGVSKGTGQVDTEIDITDVASSTTNYLFIQVAQGSGDEIHGGYVTIAAS